MRKRELLEKIQALEKRVEDLENTYTLYRPFYHPPPTLPQDPNRTDWKYIYPNPVCSSGVSEATTGRIQVIQ